MNLLTSSSLVDSRSARVALARERYFEEGQSPAGVVSELVFESWARCLRVLGSPSRSVAFEPVTPSRTHLALQRNRHLLGAWQAEMPKLEALLGTTSCAAMLTDASGVLIGSTCVGRAHERLMPVATRLGVNLAEDAVGTTAPGVVVRTGRPVSVQGGEHFFAGVQEMHCAAAPIRDVEGRVAGVLDLSSEHMPFAFDAAAVAGVYASAIENRLLLAQSTEHLVVRLQVSPDLLDTAMVGLMGIDGRGRVAWANAVARQLLAPVRPGALAGDPLDAVGLAWSQLAALPGSGAALLPVPNGLTLWARAHMHAADGRRQLFGGVARCAPPDLPPVQGVLHSLHRADAPTPDGPAAMTPPAGEDQVPAVEPRAPQTDGEPPKLRESKRALIARTLQAFGGNVSEAARHLGVSRGVIYRHLRVGAVSSPPSAH